MGFAYLVPWGCLPVQTRVRANALSSLTGGFGSTNGDGLQGGDNWQRMPMFPVCCSCRFENYRG